MSFRKSTAMLKKNDYDNDDGLDEAKKKQFGYRQFESFDKTDKKSKLDEKKKKKRRLKIEKKVFIKRDLLNILAMNLLR